MTRARRVIGVVVVATLAVASAVATPVRANAESAPAGRLVFERYNGQTHRNDVYVANADGSNQRLTAHDADMPMWSHDGSRVLFEHFVAGSDNWSAVALDLRSNAEQVLTTQGWDPVHFQWSHDESKLIYTKAGPEGPTPGGRRIFMVDTIGSNDHQVIQHGDIVWDFAWSADASRIVLTRGAEWADGSLYTVNADGTDEAPVHIGDILASSPRFSPDGSRIVFVGYHAKWYGAPGGQSAIFTVHDDGTDLRQLTAYTDRNLQGSTFAPDGQSIVFALLPNLEKTDDPKGLFRVNSDGSGLTQLTRGADSYPDWTATPAPNVAPQPVARLALPLKLTLLVDAGTSRDPDGVIVSYEWRWGDGSPFGFGRRASHAYAKAGWYYVRLTVTDNSGGTGTRAAWVQIS